MKQENYFCTSCGFEPQIIHDYRKELEYCPACGNHSLEKIHHCDNCGQPLHSSDDIQCDICTIDEEDGL